MKELDWEKINKNLDMANFSIIGCVLPEGLEDEVRDILEVVFNRIQVEPQSKEVTQCFISVTKKEKNEEQIFTDDQLSVLKNIFNFATRDEVVSCIGLVLWHFSGDYQAAKRAVEAYKNLFNRKKELDEARKGEALKNALIAFDLMTQLGKKLKEEAVEFVCNIIDESISDNEDTVMKTQNFSVY
ncbi:hypothetical protein OfM1_11660 [Lactovum odontotermitis]